MPISLKNLSNFCNSYAGWLDQKKELKSELPEHFQRVAEENLDGCNEALVRMRASINMLSQNETALRAFRLANHAMLLQQLRGGIERKKMNISFHLTRMTLKLWKSVNGGLFS